MKIALHNLQRQRRINRLALKRLLLFLARKLSPAPAPRADWKAPDRYDALSLILVDHSKIRALKKRFFAMAIHTDVITFHYAIPSRDGIQTCGEVIVNVQQAVDNGHRPRGADHELALYIAHGIDHLCGYDDPTSHARRKMRRRELTWLRQARQKGLFAGLLIAPDSDAPFKAKPTP